MQPAGGATPTTRQRSPSRRTERGSAKCAQIRVRAGELFLQRGYDGVSLDEIVRDVGGSKTNIYGFYGGKEGLFLAVVEHLCDALQEPLEALPDSGLPLAPALERIGRALLDVLLAPRHIALYRLVVGASGRFPAVARVWHEHGPQATQRRIAAFLMTRQATGELAPDVDCTGLARAFHDMLVYGPIHRAVVGETDAGEVDVAGAVRRVLGR